MTEPVKLKKPPAKRKALSPKDAQKVESSFLPEQSDLKEAPRYSLDETDYLIELSQLVNLNPSGDMRGSKIAVRMFSFPTGKIVMGIVISELPDSFLVVMPHAIDAIDDGTLKVASISPSAVARMYKTIVGLTCIPEAKFTLPYLTVVKANFEKLSGFFNEERKAQVESLIIQLEEVYREEAKTSRYVKSDNKNLNSTSRFTPPEALSSRVRH